MRISDWSSDVCSSDLREIREFSPPDEQTPLSHPPCIHQRVSKETYLDTVASLRRNILDGDVYALNYCMDFYAEDYDCDPARLFMRLKIGRASGRERGCEYV